MLLLELSKARLKSPMGDAVRRRVSGADDGFASFEFTDGSECQFCLVEREAVGYLGGEMLTPFGAIQELDRGVEMAVFKGPTAVDL